MKTETPLNQMGPKFLRVFKFLIYSGLTSARVVCSHPILRLNSGCTVHLAITVIKSLKIFQVPDLPWVN